MARIQIAQEYKRTVSMEMPGEPKEVNGKWTDTTVDIRWIAVFRDLDPEQLQSIQEQIQEQIKPLFGLLRKLTDVQKSLQKGSDVDSQALGETIQESQQAMQSVGDMQPLLDQQFVRAEQLTITDHEGNELGADKVREFVLRHPRYRAALQKVWEKDNEQGGASLGNLLKSAGAGRA